MFKWVHVNFPIKNLFKMKFTTFCFSFAYVTFCFHMSFFKNPKIQHTCKEHYLLNDSNIQKVLKGFKKWIKKKIDKISLNDYHQCKHITEFLSLAEKKWVKIIFIIFSSNFTQNFCQESRAKIWKEGCIRGWCFGFS